MASDHLDAENENTEQNELPQIEDLKIQVNITVLYCMEALLTLIHCCKIIQD